MFGSIGAPEITVIFLIALLIFGPRKLPQLGRTIGKSLAEFRRATSDLKRTLEKEINQEDPPPIPDPEKPRIDLDPESSSQTKKSSPE